MLLKLKKTIIDLIENNQLLLLWHQFFDQLSLFLVNNSLADKAKLVKDANTAKNVALYFKGAFFAIHPNKGIIATCPKGDSIAVFINAMNLASMIPLVKSLV